MTQRSTIVTGAGAGLGAAFAKAIAAAGSHVLINNRRHTDRLFQAEAVLKAILASGGSGAIDDHAVDTDEGPSAIVEAALDKTGRIDALILNAGISGLALKVGDGETDLREVMEINFFANVRLVEAALPHLRRSPAGRIVFVSSTGGLHGVRGRSAYAASKGAITAFALSIADELRRDRIAVNVLAPYAQTKMTARPDREPDPRLAPEEAGPICAWLASEACTRTGEIWVAGGGRVRAAKAVESRAARFEPSVLEKLASLPDARGYKGGEAAFADFYEDAFGENT